MSQQRLFARGASTFGGLRERSVSVFRSAITDFYLADPEYVPQLPPQRF